MSGFRKMLNLPEKQPSKKTSARRDDDGPAPEPRPSTRRATAPSWEQETESATGSIARRAGRFALWAVIALLAASGVRSWITPAGSGHTTTAPGPAATAHAGDVPELPAQQVAAEFARSYLTWDSRNPAQRERELAANLPQGADPKMGWNGSGSQQVAQTIPGAVAQLGGKRARVMVDVRVSVTAQRNGQTQVTNSWRGLQVPVALAAGRVIVTGPPALTGLPGPVPYTAPAAPDVDNALSAATQSTIHDFFVAWAAGTQDQAAAPGASIAPLGDGISLASL